VRNAAVGDSWSNVKAPLAPGVGSGGWSSAHGRHAARMRWRKK
jgi:hypothetical protein